MICRSCGMDSRVPNVCEWCKRPIAGGGPTPIQQAPPLNMNQPMQAQPLNGAPPLNGTLQQTMPQQGMTQNAPSPNATISRTTLTGEVIQVPNNVPVFNGLPGSYPQPNAINLPGSVPHPMMGAGLPAGAYSPSMMTRNNGAQVSFIERLEKFFAFCFPILIASALIVHHSPSMSLWIMLADMFVIPLLLGMTHVIPGYDDGVEDVVVMLVVTFLFWFFIGPLYGPLVTLAIYGVVCLIKQECTAVIFAILLTNLGVLVLMLYAGLTSGSLTNGALMTVGVMGLLDIFGVIVGYGGWVVSSFFRPLDMDS